MGGRSDGFFEAGKTYVEAKPFRAPEDLKRFQCVLVVEGPGEVGTTAFGFGCHVWPGDDWLPCAPNREVWEWGWSEEVNRDEEK